MCQSRWGYSDSWCYGGFHSGIVTDAAADEYSHVTDGNVDPTAMCDEHANAGAESDLDQHTVVVSNGDSD